MYVLVYNSLWWCYVICILWNRKIVDGSTSTKIKKEYQCSQELMNYNSYDVSKEGMKVVLEDVMTPSFKWTKDDCY